MSMISFDAGLVESGDVSVAEQRFRNFVAVQDVPPQKTLFIEVLGEVLVGNPGIDVELSYAIPQGINPQILVLRANLIQKAGLWPQLMTWKPARYFSLLQKYDQYSEVQVEAIFGSETIKVTDRIRLLEPADR
ncbi:hypothetical protein ABIC65_002733 [Sphingomonas trueperi]|uniref:hypothetical protein n=1 Tax=Sphingomonas trueperi TaxID=53317 RepID=UPI0033956109